MAVQSSLLLMSKNAVRRTTRPRPVTKPANNAGGVGFFSGSK
jgi:hypothetical protein